MFNIKKGQLLYLQTSIELLKFVLYFKAEGYKRKEMNYSSLNLNATTFVFILQPWGQRRI